MRHLLFIVLLIPGLASAEIYRWTDAQGRVHFGERPGAAGAETVEVKPQVVERDEATRQREQRTEEYFDARRDEKAASDARVAQVRAAQGTRSATGSTRNGAERSSGFAAEGARTNPGGLALGTDRHKYSLKNRVEGK